MSNEELERKMEFIVEHQAQFASDIQQLREMQAQIGEHLAQTGRHLAQTGQRLSQNEQQLAQTEQLLTRLVSVTHEGFMDLKAKIEALVDSQIRLSDAHAGESKDLNAKIEALVDSHIRLTAAQDRTDEAQSRTEETLRNLIALVDRYFRDGGNGQPKV